MIKHLNGKLITFEGGECAGKTTQIHILADRLKAEGGDVVVIREPGGTPIGETLRAILKHPPQFLCPQTELCLFIAARCQLVREVIKPSLEAGKIVLCDRFTDSTIVYQGLSRGLPLSIVNQFNEFATESLVPHKTIYLDLPTEVSLARMTQRGEPLDDLEASPSSFHEAVRYGYISLFQNHSHRIHSFDATIPLEVLSDQIWEFMMAESSQ